MKIGLLEAGNNYDTELEKKAGTKRTYCGKPGVILRIDECLFSRQLGTVVSAGSFVGDVLF